MKIYLFVLLIALEHGCRQGSKPASNVESKENCSIKDETTFVGIAEKILFERYGERKIVKQKPYKIMFKNDSIWSMEGSLMENHYGGVFYIELNCRTSEVIKLQHTK